MATTRTVFNWPVPEIGDFLKVGWSAIQQLADGIAATIVSIRDRPVAILRQTTAQTGITTATWATILLQAEDLDTHNGHDLITNSSRYTIPVGQGGVYAFDGVVPFPPASVAQTRIGTRIMKNGAETAGTQGTLVTTSYAHNHTIGTGRVVMSLVSGDYIELQAYQENGAAWSTRVDGVTTARLTVERIR